MEGPVASTYIAKHAGGNRLERLEPPLYAKALHAGVKRENPELMAQVNKGLSLMRPEETLATIQGWTGKIQPAMVKPQTKRVKIAVSIDNMPFHFADGNNRATGYFVELWNLWSQKTGVAVEFITAPWAKSLDMVKSGEADIHAGCFFSVQRDAFLDYAGVLSNCETHFFFHDSIFGLKNLEDLKGFQIGLLDQDYAAEFVTRALPEAPIKKYPSHTALFQGVARGEVRVFICDTPTALYFLEKQGLLSKFRYHPDHPLYRKPFYAAVKEGNAALVQLVNKGLEAISAQERAAIERHWMGARESKASDVLVVAVPLGFAPFAIRNAEGDPSGLFVDLWKAWSQRTGKAVDFRIYPRQEAIRALKNGVVDVLSFIPPREAISGWAQKSTLFYRLNWHVYRYNKKAPQASPAGSREVLGVMKGSRAHEWLGQNRPDIEIRPFNTTRQMLLSAVAGGVDGFVALPHEMGVLPHQLGLPDAFTPDKAPLFQEQMGGVVRKFNSQLIHLIDKGFDAMEHQEKLHIEKRWIKDPGARIFNPRNEKILLTRKEEKWLKAYHDVSTPIRLGVNPQWPPFEFIGTDQAYRGMVSDYVKLLNQRLGLNMNLVESLAGPSGRERPEFDVIPSALSFARDRENRLRTRPYLKFPWVIINRQEAPLMGGLRDLHGKTLAVIRHYALRDIIPRQHPSIRILEVDTTRQGLEAVHSGRAQGYIGNLALAGYQIQAHNYTELKVAAGTDLPGTGLVFSVRKDWPALVGILNKGIASISDQEHDQIRQKWFSVRFEHQVDAGYLRDLLIKIGIATFILATGFSFWNRQMRIRKEEAEAANLSKTRFLASLSHEIRNPLNAILGMTEMTLKSPLTFQNKKNLTSVKESALHLLDVITDILDFSTIEAGKMRIQPQRFHLPDLLNNLEHTWKFLAGEKGLWFKLITPKGLPTAVESDPIRLQQVLGNLISNAVKFTHTGGVDLTVKPVHRAKDVVSLLFTVEDTGIGIGQDQQKKIFKRFTQAEESVTRNYGGTGLGLSICRETARLMGGSLKVKSSLGQGSRFDLKLPIKTVQARLLQPAPPTGSATPETPRPLTLLLAEDDPVNARVFKAFLADTPHTILHAKNGLKALDLLKHHPVDMIFMDIEMPKMDGITATLAIREGKAGPDKAQIPIVAMSAHVLREIEQKSRKAGMNDFIAKPVDLDHLLQVIQALAPPKPKAKEQEPMEWDRALASLGNNKTLLLKIMDIFLQETPAQLAELEKALADERPTEIQRWAHTLKGSASRIFAEDCTRAAQKLETAARKKKMETIKSQARTTLDQFKILVAWLEKTTRKEKEPRP